MTNNFENIPAESEFRDEMTPDPWENEQPYDGAGFPGCGDGSDDLADFNADEAMDYCDE